MEGEKAVLVDYLMHIRSEGRGRAVIKRDLSVGSHVLRGPYTGSVNRGSDHANT
jgi:hypothetical protein